MILKWSCTVLIVALIISVDALTDSDVEALINLSEFGYEDKCQIIAQAKWNFIDRPDASNKKILENSLEEYAEYIRNQKEGIGAVANETYDDSLAEYKYNLLTKPGDALLDAKQWKNFVSFACDTEGSIMTKNSQKITSLSSEHGADEKLAEWITYNENVYSIAANFSKNLQLVRAASVENGLDNVGDYWSMLTGYGDGYEEIENMWNDITELHEKIIKVAKSRLTLKYPQLMDNYNDHIPEHLLRADGQDDNWVSLALMLSPYPNVTFEIEEKILNKSVGGTLLYKSASRLGKIILKHEPDLSFWTDSNFNGQCPSKLINFCNEETRVVTCSLPSMANYISAHKDMASVLIPIISRESNPILAMSNRYSPLEAGISELFGVLSMNRAWLVSLNLLDASDDPDEIRIISLLITALDILPRMAHYLAIDMWRLDALNNSYFDNNNDDDDDDDDIEKLTDSWWAYREKYEKITTPSPRNTTPTYITDPYVINNKPYMHKFLGILLGFQIYEYLMESTETRYDKIEPDTPKRQLIKTIQHNWSQDWSKVVEKYLKVDKISTRSLLSYFTPLKEYLNDIDDNITIPIPFQLESKLSKLRTLKNNQSMEKVLKSTTPSSLTNNSNDSEITTTTKTTTTTTITIITNTTAESHKSETAIPHAQHHPPNSQDKIILQPQSPMIVNENKSDSDSDSIMKSSTNKAVWAVGAVLIATIAVVIIAIFGRRRCRRSPKNRRYV